MLIGISGKKFAGKDAIANRLVDKHGFRKLAFADPLKEVCRVVYHLSDGQLFGSLKEIKDPRWQDQTPRELFQITGTAFRNINLNIWINSLNIKLNQLTIQGVTNIVISDVRFLNEIHFFQQNLGLLWKVNRETQSNEFNDHISETELDTFNNWNQIIDNNSSLRELYSKVDLALKSSQEIKYHGNNRRKPESSRRS